jgi:hypothetical protein
VKLMLSSVLMIAALLIAGPVSADMEWEVGLGYSLPTGDFQKGTVQGLNLGGDVLWYPIDALPGLGIGGQFRANRFDTTHPTLGTGNYYSMFETLPTIRYNLFGRQRQMDFFLQAAFGVYLWSYEEEVYIAATDTFYTVDNPGNSSGMSLGFGFSYLLKRGQRFVVSPCYNFVNTGDDATRYYTVNVGYGF